MDLVFVLIQDAGLKPSDVNVKYVADITLNPDNKHLESTILLEHSEETIPWMVPQRYILIYSH